MTYTPSSAIDFIEHFENSFNGSDPFYYEPTAGGSTATINFGYGINLTAAEDAATASTPNTTLKDDLIKWLSNNGIPVNTTKDTVAGVAWSELSTASLTKNNNGSIVATFLNADLSSGKSYISAATSVLTSYISAIVVPALTKLIPNLTSLPATTQWALEAMYYNGPGTLGTNTYNAAKAGNLVGVAEQLAFNANKSPSTSQPGLEERYLGSALLALGIIPTFNASNIITSINTSGATASNVTNFISDILNPSNTLGSGGVSALAYVSKWGTGPVTSLENILITQGYFLPQATDTWTSIAT